MTPTGQIECRVLVNGARLADTAEAFEASTPTALSGLSLVWGRENVVDQPSTSTCSFTVRDKGGDQDFIALLHTGYPVEVWASSEISSGSAPVNIAVDGGFEDGSVAVAKRAYAQTGIASYATDAVHSGVRALRVDGIATAAARVYIGPAPFGAADAWDDIPKTATGQRWTVQAAVKAAAGAATTLRPWAATSSVAGPNGPLLPGVTIPAAPAGTVWTTQRVEWTVQASDPAGTWVGVALELGSFVAWSAWPGTWAEQPAGLTWRDLGSAVVDDVQILAPPAAVRNVLVFSGRIKSLVAKPAGSGVSIDVIAADWTADLANADVSDNPWLAEKVSVRVPRILALAGGDVTASIDSFPAGQIVSWRDVDSQPAMDLLSSLAISTDSVLWSAWHGSRGFFLWYEDPAKRTALRVLGIDPDTGFVDIIGSTRPSDGIYLPSCSIALEPLTMTQDVADVVTRVDLVWLEQTLDDKGLPAPTERHVLLVDTDAEASWGQQRVSVSTELTTSAAANTVAARVINRSRSLGWRADGLVWDTRLPEDFTDGDRTAALDLLDGTIRIGAPIIVEHMPGWTPTGSSLVSYLEGGSYSYEHGRWTFDLKISPSGQTGASAKWRDLPIAWRWIDFDPSLAWFDLLGTAVGTA